jgi:DNA-binding beta-propeller fold protein YncE
MRYVKTVGVYNNSASGRGFANPVDLVVGKDGRIFVLNRGKYCRVGVCNLDEEYLYEFGSLGDDDGQFRLASAIALDSREHLYIADESHNRISVFDSSGAFLGKGGEPGSGDGQLAGPSGLAFDSEDNVYVVDQNNNRVQKLTSEGAYLTQWGGPGNDDGQFNLPWGITIDSEGNVYVADWRNDRIQKFAPDGRFLAKFGEPGDGDGQFHRPSSVAVDSEGYIYVADWGNERVQVLAPDGSFLLGLQGQATLSVWAQEFLDANVDEKTPREKANLVPELPSHLDTPYLISAQTEPYFWGPVVNLDSEGRLYVTEASRHRIQVYQRS